MTPRAVARIELGPAAAIEKNVTLWRQAIEAGANEVEPLTTEQNDDVPEGAIGARLLTDRAGVHTVSKWLSGHGWKVVTSELGYVPKNFPDLNEQQ